MNVPRLTDRYLGECGSRRCVMRSELDSSRDQGSADARQAFAAEVAQTILALPLHTSSPVCGWTEARRSHAMDTGSVIDKSIDELAVYRPKEHYGGPLGVCEWGFTAAVCVLLAMGLHVCIRYHLRQISDAHGGLGEQAQHASWLDLLQHSLENRRLQPRRDNNLTRPSFPWSLL